MKIIYSLSILLVFGSLLTAQVSSKIDNTVMNSFSRQDELRKALSGSQGRNVTGFDNRYEGVKGSPFLYEEWLDGKLVLADSAVVANKLQYKYDTYNNEIWVKMNDGQERILYNKELMYLELYTPKGEKIKLKKVKLPDSFDRHQFAVSVFTGNNVSLIKHVKKVFRHSNLEDKGMVTVGNAYDWFEDVTTYYVKKKDKEFEKAAVKKSNFVEALRLSKPATESVEKFCKTNDIKGKLTDEDAIKIMAYVDLILEN